MDRISAIFDEVQQSPSAGFKALSQKLRKTLQSAESDDVRSMMLTGIWRGCMDQCLLCPKKDRTVEKMVLFLTNFISSSLVGGDEHVLASGMDHLLQRSRALDKAVRLRACQLIAGIMLKIQGAEIAEDVLIKMVDVLTPRLRDKAPNVRVWAVKIFEWFQQDDDFIMEEMTRLLTEDSCKEVRVAALESICISKTILSLIIARVKDIKPEVRIAAMKRLADAFINVKNLDSTSIALIVRFGLNDRDASVKMACKSLVLKWLADYGNNVPKFLRFMDFEMNEEEVETVCHAVMEMVEKGECNVPHDLCVAVRQDGPNWEETSVAKFNPSEILWAFNRCDYAHKHMSQTAAAAFVDALVPDMVTLGAMLQDARKPALYSSAKYQMNVRYLIRLTGFLDASDVCGCKGLVQVFEEMLSDTNLPEMLVEPMLASWQLASGFSGSTASIHAAVALSQQVAAQATPVSTSPRSSLGEEGDVALPGDSDDEDEGEERRERHRTLASIRSLQVVSWSLTQHIGNRDTILGFGQYDIVVPFIVECLSQPCPDLRGLSVRCLGLLSLASQEKCQDFHQIMLQVARNEIEEAEIRCQALEALVDMATVYGERFQDDSALTQFLLRLQIDGAEPALLRVGAESAAKLLFSGRLSEPKLFANLIKFFFLPELAGEQENKPVEEAYMGSAARLQQILSVFFQAFFVAGNGREDIAFGCTSDLVADLAMLIRDQEIDPSAMGRMAQNLLALCENIKNPLSATSVSVLAPVPVSAPASETEPESGPVPESAPPAAAAAAPADQDFAETARNVFRMRLTASLCREVLKMGSSRVEKAAIKEFVKVMGTLAPQSWMRPDLAPTLLTILDTIAQCCTLEPAVQKVLVERVASACEAHCPAVIEDEEDSPTSGRFQFFNLAPGLGDMLQLTLKDLDADQTKDLREGCRQYLRESAPSSSHLAKKPVKRAAKSKGRKDDEEDDEEDEEEDEDEEEENLFVAPKGKATSKVAVLPPPAPLAASNRPSRSSKSAAATKIASQLSQQDNAPPVEML